jgi:hypothetical protein
MLITCWGYGSAVEYLPRMYEALLSIFGTEKKKQKTKNKTSDANRPKKKKKPPTKLWLFS